MVHAKSDIPQADCSVKINTSRKRAPSNFEGALFHFLDFSYNKTGERNEKIFIVFFN